MQQNAQIEQEAPLFADPEGKKGVADKPRRHADEQHIFHPEATEQQRDHSIKTISDIWPNDIAVLTSLTPASARYDAV